MVGAHFSQNADTVCAKKQNKNVFPFPSQLYSTCKTGVFRYVGICQLLLWHSFHLKERDLSLKDMFRSHGPLMINISLYLNECMIYAEKASLLQIVIFKRSSKSQNGLET